MSSIKTFVIKMRCREKVYLKKSELSMMPVPDKDAIIITALQYYRNYLSILQFQRTLCRLRF